MLFLKLDPNLLVATADDTQNALWTYSIKNDIQCEEDSYHAILSTGPGIFTYVKPLACGGKVSKLLALDSNLDLSDSKDNLLASLLCPLEIAVIVLNFPMNI